MTNGLLQSKRIAVGDSLPSLTVMVAAVYLSAMAYISVLLGRMWLKICMTSCLNWLALTVEDSAGLALGNGELTAGAVGVGC